MHLERRCCVLVARVGHHLAHILDNKPRDGQVSAVFIEPKRRVCLSTNALDALDRRVAHAGRHGRRLFHSRRVSWEQRQTKALLGSDLSLYHVMTESSNK